MDRTIQDYQPVDLADLCNTGSDFIVPQPARLSVSPTANSAQPALGKQVFHGLPFIIGKPVPDPSRCFIGFDPVKDNQQHVTVPLGCKARWIIFAHALLESRVLQGEDIGRTVAYYVCRYRDADSVRLPVRERFEVSVVPTKFGQLPFLARPDQMDYMLPRHEGDWGNAGIRQLESQQGQPHSYYLWAWMNPHPDNIIQSITVEPNERWPWPPLPRLSPSVSLPIGSR